MKQFSRRVSMRSTYFLVLLALTPTTLMAKSTMITDGQTQLRVTDDPVQRRCVVLKSSGVYETDQLACDRALAAIPSIASGLPEGTHLFPGRDRRYASGTCVYRNGARPTTDEKAICTELLDSMGNARVPMAINPESWVRPEDLKGLVGNRGRVAVSIGISTAGEATYCTVAKASANNSLGALVCQSILRRAKFDPALDKDGQPTASAYDRQWAF
jgi:hypothetical protein